MEEKPKRDILKKVIIAILCLVILFFVFGLGVIVGEKKAKFSFLWAENYHKNFAGPPQGFLRDWRKGPFAKREFIEGHGAFGEIIEVKDDSFVIKGRGDIEKVILITKDTVIKKGMETIKDNLKVGDFVVVIGSPNKEGQIEAKLIRVFEKNPKNLPFKGYKFQFF